MSPVPLEPLCTTRGEIKSVVHDAFTLHQPELQPLGPVLAGSDEAILPKAPQVIACRSLRKPKLHHQVLKGHRVPLAGFLRHKLQNFRFRDHLQFILSSWEPAFRHPSHRSVVRMPLSGCFRSIPEAGSPNIPFDAVRIFCYDTSIKLS